MERMHACSPLCAPVDLPGGAAQSAALVAEPHSGHAQAAPPPQPPAPATPPRQLACARARARHPCARPDASNALALMCSASRACAPRRAHLCAPARVALRACARARCAARPPHARRDLPHARRAALVCVCRLASNSGSRLQRPFGARVSAVGSCSWGDRSIPAQGPRSEAGCLAAGLKAHRACCRWLTSPRLICPVPAASPSMRRSSHGRRCGEPTGARVVRAHVPRGGGWRARVGALPCLGRGAPCAGGAGVVLWAGVAAACRGVPRAVAR